MLTCQPNTCGKLTNLVLGLINMPFLQNVNSSAVSRWHVSRLNIIGKTFNCHLPVTFCFESGSMRAEIASVNFMPLFGTECFVLPFAV
jgi:hypothetical protein